MKTIPGKTEQDAAICYVGNKIVVQKGGLSGAGTAAAGWLLFGPEAAWRSPDEEDDELGVAPDNL